MDHHNVVYIQSVCITKHIMLHHFINMNISYTILYHIVEYMCPASLRGWNVLPAAARYLCRASRTGSSPLCAASPRSACT